MKKWTILLICIALSLICASALAATSGTCGDCQWTLDDEGALTVTGNGKMSYGAWEKNNVKKAIIQDGVTSIYKESFKDSPNLEEVEIADSVTEVGMYAFSGCTSLKTVKLPKNLQTIELCLFWKCAALNTVTFPETGTRIRGGAFRDCTALETINLPDKTKIEDDAFKECTGLKTVYFAGPQINTVDFIKTTGNDYLLNAKWVYGEASTGNWNQLTWKLEDDLLTISGSGAMKDIPKDSYYISGTHMTPRKDSAWRLYKSMIRRVRIENGITSIGAGAFEGFTDLASVSLPESLTAIGENAFERCKNLPSVTIPAAVTEIGTNAFAVCDCLTNVTFAESVNRLVIGFGCFQQCGMTSIAFPEGTTTINSSVFWWCENLKEITIPISVTEIVAEFFEDCTHLEKVTVSLCNPYVISWMKENGHEDLVSTTPHRNIVPDAAVAPHCEDGLTEGSHCSVCGQVIVAQEPVKGTGHSWGEPTYTWINNNKQVTAKRICANDSSHTETETADATSTVSKPATCKEMGDTTYTWSFSNPAFKTQTKTLTDIPLAGHSLTFHDKEPPTCGKAGTEPYWECSVCHKLFSDEKGKTEITVPKEIPMTEHAWGAADYVWSDDNSEVTAKRVCGNDSSHKETETVKATYQIKKEATATETGIGVYTSNAFNNTAFSIQTKEVVIPKITEDPKDPENPEDPKDPENPEDPKDPENPEDPKDPEEPEQPEMKDKITKNGIVYQLNHQKKTAAVVKASKKTITKATIPATVKANNITYKVTEIKAKAFKGKTKLTKVSIGKNVTTIGKQAFYGCVQLKTVSGMAGVTTIGDSAFEKCKVLPKFTIPAKVKKIGAKAFFNCPKLATITIQTTKLAEKNVGANAFNTKNKKTVYKVPAKKLKAYRKWMVKKGVPDKKQVQ